MTACGQTQMKTENGLKLLSSKWISANVTDKKRNELDVKTECRTH